MLHNLVVFHHKWYQHGSCVHHMHQGGAACNGSGSVRKLREGYSPYSDRVFPSMLHGHSSSMTLAWPLLKESIHSHMRGSAKSVSRYCVECLTWVCAAITTLVHKNRTLHADICCAYCKSSCHIDETNGERQLNDGSQLRYYNNREFLCAISSGSNHKRKGGYESFRLLSYLVYFMWFVSKFDLLPQ